MADDNGRTKFRKNLDFCKQSVGNPMNEQKIPPSAAFFLFTYLLLGMGEIEMMAEPEKSPSSFKKFATNVGNFITTRKFFNSKFGLYKPRFELHKPNLELYKPNLGL